MSKFFAARKFTLTAGMAILIGIPTVGWTGDQVPLDATFATNFQFIFTGPCEASVPVTGVGQVSHLGNATTTIQQTVELLPCPLPQSGTWSGTQIGTMTVQGANNGECTRTSPPTCDTLTATFTGAFTVDLQSGFLNAAGDIVFTGGSGRFEGASGNASFTVVANIFTAQGVFKFSGSISSPGSLKQ